jgi:glucosamine--fructose-6-phosphate aminotransferase (isomerizing)
MSTALAKMIAAQPEALVALSDPGPYAEPAHRLAGAARIWFIGTGTSQHAAELAAITLTGAGRDARWVAANAFHAGLLRPGDAAVVITHTGRTGYAQRARRIVQEAGLPLVTITGPDSDWPEAIRTPTVELSETYTVSYCTALAVLAQLAHHLGVPGIGAPAIRETAERVRATLTDGSVDAVPMPARAMAIVGPGPWAITAREGALKIREGARILCEGFDPDRLLHGGAVPYGSADTLLVLQPQDDPDGLTAAIADAARREKIPLAIFSETSGAGGALLGQIPMTVRLQRLALRFAVQRGQDPDVAITGAWGESALWEIGTPAPATP